MTALLCIINVIINLTMCNLFNLKTEVFFETNNPYKVSNEKNDTTKTILICGRVFEKQDKKTEPLPALIMLKGTKIFTYANEYGYYQLEITQKNCKQKIIIQCQYIGYKNQEITLKNVTKSNIEANFKMIPFYDARTEYIEQKPLETNPKKNK
jgi:hypothetical protein